MKIFHAQGFHLVLGFILGCLATLGIALVGWDALFVNIKFTDFLNLIVTCVLGFSINATLSRRIGHEMKLVDSIADALEKIREMASELAAKSQELLTGSSRAQMLRSEIVALARTLSNQTYDFCHCANDLPEAICILRGDELKKASFRLRKVCTDKPFSAIGEADRLLVAAEIAEALAKMNRVQFRMKLEVLGGSKVGPQLFSS
jgi:hypothetical protein